MSPDIVFEVCPLDEGLTYEMGLCCRKAHLQGNEILVRSYVHTARETRACFRMHQSKGVGD